MASFPIQMIRNYTNIPIAVILLNDNMLCSDYIPNKIINNKINKEKFKLICDKFDVELIEKKPINENMFYNKEYLKELNYKNILYLDADTFIFGNIELIFEKYKEEEFYGSAARWMEVYDWDKKLLNKPNFRLGVQLWNNSIQKWDLNKITDELKIWLKNNTTNKYTGVDFTIPLSIESYGIFEDLDVFTVNSSFDKNMFKKSLIFHSCFSSWKYFYDILNKRYTKFYKAIEETMK